MTAVEATPTPLAPNAAVLSERYLQYLDLCVADDADELTISIQDLFFRRRKAEAFTLVHIGDGCRNEEAYVRTSDGQEAWIKLSDLRTGSKRGVPRGGRIHMGKTSLMGTIAHGIANGRVFRGR